MVDPRKHGNENLCFIIFFGTICEFDFVLKLVNFKPLNIKVK
jgi:hypothetical protein